MVFTGLASEADPPRKKNKKTGEWVSEITWWRSPFIASFSAGNFDFVMITAHIRWGKKETDRIVELKLLADWVEKRRKDSFGVDRDIIVLGDFNIPKMGDALYKAITSRGLKAPAALLKEDLGSNLVKDKRYDQILHYPKETKCFTDNAGGLDFYTGGIKKLYPDKTPDKEAFTYEMSDHLPVRIQIDVDAESEKLDQIIKQKLG